MSTHATLLISCRDAPGIVACVAGFIAEHGGNILDSDQHTDEEEGVFFMRVEFELTGFRLDRREIGPSLQTRLLTHGPSVEVRLSEHRKQGAILVTKADHCLYDLLLRQRSGEIRCDFPVIISNHDKLAEVAGHFGIQFLHLPVNASTRRAQEDRIMAELEERKIDFVVLARYMQILTAEFVDRFPSRIINIHHSFLPAFRGARPYHQAYRRGVKVIGATGHYVTPELDTGPIIAQDVVDVSHRDTVRDLIHKGRDLEKVVLARAVRWHVEDRVLAYANRTVVFP